MKKHTCPDCGETDSTQFWRDSRKGQGGLQTYCIDCSKKRRKGWAQENQDVLQKYNKDRYKQIRKDPERWEDKLRQNARYRKKHRYHSQVHWNNHRARTQYKSSDTIKVSEWLALLKEHPDNCPGCKSPWYLAGAATIDHIKPLILKGKNLIENIQPLCRSCNTRKSKRTMKFIRKKIEEKNNAEMGD